MGYPHLRFRCLSALALVLTWAAGSHAQTIPNDGQPDVLVGTGSGQGLVRLLNGADGSELVSGYPWGTGATQGVRVAAGDVTGDGVADLLVATGPGDGRVSVFNGATASLIITFAPFGEHFRGGVHMATGDIDGDGRIDVIVGGGSGSGRVRIYSSATYQQIVTGFPFGTDYTGGLTVGAGDVNGDGQVDVIVGQETGGLVRVFDGAGPAILAGGTPYGAGFTGGIYVAGGDVDGDGDAEVITGQREGGRTVLVIDAMTMQIVAGFAPFGSGNGVSVAAGDLDGDGNADLVVGTGPGSTPRVRVFRGPDGPELMGGMVFDADFLGGVFVATTAEAAALRFTSEDETTFEAGVNGTFAITTAGPASPITMTGTLPSGVTFTDNGDGTAALEGTPAAGTGGTHALRFIAGAGTPLEADQAFTLIVNEAPAITSVGATTFPLGAPGTFTITTTGFPEPGITLGGAALPAGVAFTDNGDGTATLSGTPDPGTGGTYALVIAAANGVGADASQAFTLTVEGAPVFTSAAATTFEVGTPGTFAITATATPPVTAITIGGAALPAGVTFVDNGNGTATLSGTPAPGTGGAYAITFTATNGVHAPTVQSFTLTINEPPAITSAASATFPLGAVNDFTVTTSGFPAPALTLGGALPAGVTFADNGNGTATFSGTPTVAGIFALTITAANGIGANAVQAFTLTVDSSPGFSSAAATTFSVGVPGTFAITTVGVPAVTSITLGGVPLPAGIAFADNGDGTATLAGTPAAATGGTYALTLTASNGFHTPVVQNFTLTVTQPPAVTSAPSTTFTVGTPATFTMTTTGFPVPSLTLTGALPTGITFADNGDGTATLGGTAAAGAGGTHLFSLTAANGVLPDAVQAFTLSVNEAPTITSPATTTFAVGDAGTFTVTATGFPTSGLSVTGALPAGVTFVDNANGTATLSGTPDAATGGVYPLTITAANGTLPDAVQAFTLNVSQAPAIISAASTTFVAGTPGSFSVTTTGSPAPTIAAGGVALPAGITFVDNGNGTGALSGTPAPGTGGSYAITFTAANGVGTDAVQSFTLIVNEAPAFTSAASTVFQVSVAGTFSITTSGFPAVSSILRTGAALPGGVAYTDNADGSATLAGTPIAGTGGTYALVFTIDNGVGGSVVQNFTLTVQQAPAITSANSASFTVGTPGTFTVTATGVPAPTLSQTGVLPTGITFTPATGVLAGTATQTGTFNAVQFTAANGVSPDAVQDFTLNVVCPAIAVNPATLPDGLFQTAYGPVSFTQTGSTGSTFSWNATGVPAGLSLSSSGVLSGTPTDTVLNGVVVVTVTDNFGCTGTRNTTITIRPVADNDAYTGGVGHTQFVVGAAVPLTPNVFVNDNVKTGDNGPGTLSVAFNQPANGVVAEGSTDGTFIYTPNVNFAGPTDTFTYTLTDGNGVTNTGSVTISLAGIVWYVNSAAGAGGDGRSHNPFNTLASVGTPSISTHYIYVHTGGAATAGDLTLDAAQTLHGQGAAFSLGALTLPAGGRPTLTGTVNLANNTIVRGLNFMPVSTALVANGVAQAITIDQVSVTGGTTALNLTNVNGPVTVSNATFTNTTAAEVLISQGMGDVTVGAAISSNAGASISIQNRTGGTVAFAGPVSVTGGTGISLTNNAGSMFAFSGGLALSTGANPAFTATGGGTVTATQNNTTIVNTITTTSGTALNVSNTTIGAAGLTFRSISVNGAANGIVLTNTGAVAGLTVTGNGGACTSAVSCTGGAIQSTVGDGLALTSTRGASLTRLFVGGTGRHGINASAVNGLTLNNSFVQFSGNADNEYGLSLTNATGIVTIDASTFNGAADDLVHLENLDTTVTFNVVNGSQFTYPVTVAPTANSAILLLPGGTAAVAATIQGATFTNVVNAAVQIGANQFNSSGTQALTFSGNTINVGLAGRASGVVVSGQELTTTNIVITNNTFNGAGGNGVVSIDTNDTSVVRGTVSGNQIINPPGIGMFVAVDEGGTSDIVIDNNTITNAGGDGIQAVNFGGDGVSTKQLAITNNVVDGHSANTAVSFVGGISFTSFEDVSCVAVRGNVVTGTPASPTQCGGAPCVDYYLEEVGGTLSLEEVPDTPLTTANAAFVNSINDPGPVTIFGVIDLTNGASCNVAPLAAAAQAPAGRQAAPPDGRDRAHSLAAATRRMDAASGFTRDPRQP